MPKGKNDRAAWKRQRRFDREMLRSAYKSLFFGIIAERRASEGFTMADLAQATKTDKSRVSRWFKGFPNWQIDTMADIAEALDVDLIVKARDRKTGRIYAEYGAESPIRATYYDGSSETRAHSLRSAEKETHMEFAAAA